MKRGKDATVDRNGKGVWGGRGEGANNEKCWNFDSNSCLHGNTFCLAQTSGPSGYETRHMSTPSLFPEDPSIELHITLDWSKERITFDWKSHQVDKKLAHGAVWVANGLLGWRITGVGRPIILIVLSNPPQSRRRSITLRAG